MPAVKPPVDFRPADSRAAVVAVEDAEAVADAEVAAVAGAVAYQPTPIVSPAGSAYV
jgi:hypothetical protein